MTTHADPSRLSCRPGNFDRLNLFYTPECGPDGTPLLKSYKGEIPERLVPFRYKSTQPKDCIHFFLDDYRFECVWNRARQYMEKFKPYTILSPDFSMFCNWNPYIQKWNFYRSMWLGAYWQSYGLNVIPTILWSCKKSYSFCFNGLPSDSVVAISSVGILGKDEKELFSEGINELVQRVHPSTILCAGGFTNKYIGKRIDSEIVEYLYEFKSHCYVHR